MTPHEAGSRPEELVDLAWMVDCAVHFGDRGQAAEMAGRLLEELSRHYRAMRPLRLRCAPHVGAALADEAFALIGDVEQIANASPEMIERAREGRATVAELRPRIEQLIAHEAAEMSALGRSF